MVFKACYTLRILHPWNITLNMCMGDADSSVLTDLKRKKYDTENYV